MMAAGNWIKMSVDLRTDPKVVRISSALKADRLRVIGALWAVWCVFDTHSTDGHLDGYDLHAMDDEIGWPGFAEAMGGVGWLVETDSGGLEAPRFDVHNGASAKRRATESVRKRDARNADEKRTESGQMSALDADKKRTREEKNRGEKRDTPKAPKGAAVRFPEFWLTWPRSVRKHDKAKCEDAWRAQGLDSQADAILADVKTKRGSPKWTAKAPDGNDFIEEPLRYLRNKRWEDGADQGADGGDERPFV